MEDRPQAQGLRAVRAGALQGRPPGSSSSLSRKDRCQRALCLSPVFGKTKVQKRRPCGGGTRPWGLVIESGGCCLDPLLGPARPRVRQQGQRGQRDIWGQRSGGGQCPHWGRRLPVEGQKLTKQEDVNTPAVRPFTSPKPSVQPEAAGVGGSENRLKGLQHPPQSYLTDPRRCAHSTGPLEGRDTRGEARGGRSGRLGLAALPSDTGVVLGHLWVRGHRQQAFSGPAMPRRPAQEAVAPQGWLRNAWGSSAHRCLRGPGRAGDVLKAATAEQSRGARPAQGRGDRRGAGETAGASREGWCQGVKWDRRAREGQAGALPGA